jgi:hypothetical protein
MFDLKKRILFAGILTFAAVVTASPAFAWNSSEHPIGGLKGINLNSMTQSNADKNCRNYIESNILLSGGAFRDVVRGRFFGVHQVNNTHKWAHRSANTCVINEGFGFFWY